jgi:uncharacterized membrane protein
MTDASAYTPRPMATSEDLTLPIVAYILYLLAVPTALLSLLIGVVIAYANRDRAGPAARSHYEFLIRTFWLSIVCILVGVAVCVVGAILSVILIGIPILIVGALMLGGAKIWYVVRCILGIVHAARHEAYPRPEALLA